MNKYHFVAVYICISRDRLLQFPWRHLVLISLATMKKTHKQLLFGDKIRKTLDEWKDNSVLAKPLAASTHLCSTVSQLFEPQVQKIAVFTYRSPHFCFPWRRPCDYHAICSMDGKIQCYFYHIIVSPGDAPGAITLNVIDGWKENSMLTNCYNRFSDRARYWSKIVIFSNPLAFDAPVKGVPVGTSPPRSVWKN